MEHIYLEQMVEKLHVLEDKFAFTDKKIFLFGDWMRNSAWRIFYILPTKRFLQKLPCGIRGKRGWTVFLLGQCNWMI